MSGVLHGSASTLIDDVSILSNHPLILMGIVFFSTSFCGSFLAHLVFAYIRSTRKSIWRILSDLLTVLLISGSLAGLVLAYITYDQWLPLLLVYMDRTELSRIDIAEWIRSRTTSVATQHAQATAAGRLH